MSLPLSLSLVSICHWIANCLLYLRFRIPKNKTRGFWARGAQRHVRGVKVWLDAIISLPLTVTWKTVTVYTHGGNTATWMGLSKEGACFVRLSLVLAPFVVIARHLRFLDSGTWRRFTSPLGKLLHEGPISGAGWSYHLCILCQKSQTK